MKILALDASTVSIGWALFDLEKDHPEDLEKYGVEKLKGDLWTRLWEAHIWLIERIVDARTNERFAFPSQVAPELVGLETPIVHKNVKSSIKVAYAVAVLGLAARKGDLEVMEIRPDERLAALGLPHRMRNPKPQVVSLVNQIYSLDLDPKTDHDIADAIAIGWATRRKLAQEGRP